MQLFAVIHLDDIAVIFFAGVANDLKRTSTRIDNGGSDRVHFVSSILELGGGDRTSGDDQCCVIR